MRGALIASTLALCTAVGCTDVHEIPLEARRVEPSDAGADLALADAAAKIIAFVHRCLDDAGPDGGYFEYTSAEMVLACFYSPLRPGCPANLLSNCGGFDPNKPIPTP